jgi:RHS repeat-associated protein
VTYTYPTGANNGKVSSMISGETVTYTYDSLNRLATATGSSGWGESYGFDPFGNLLSKTVTAGSFFPWGEPKATNPQDTWSYATYWADSATGLDYANNRYYSNSYGRFMTPDPYRSSAGPADPQSWNRYAYTRGDPVNRIDPGGTCDTSTDGDYSVTVCDDDPFAGFWESMGSINFGAGCAAGYMQACSFSQFGGQGGVTASGPSAGVAHSPGSSVGPAGYNGAYALLQNASPQCLKDLTPPGSTATAATAASTLKGSTINYTLGPTPQEDATGQIVGGSPAQSSPSPSGNVIDINLNFGWMNPAQVIFQNATTGGFFYANWLVSVGTSIGDPSLTITQYHELVLLHEVGHLLGVPQESSTSPYNTNIFNDCIKGH